MPTLLDVKSALHGSGRENMHGGTQGGADGTPQNSAPKITNNLSAKRHDHPENIN
jgi:hypothetical protein